MAIFGGHRGVQGRRQRRGCRTIRLGEQWHPSGMLKAT